MNKKLLATLLTVVLVLSIFPTMVFATEPSTTLKYDNLEVTRPNDGKGEFTIKNTAGVRNVTIKRIYDFEKGKDSNWQRWSKMRGYLPKKQKFSAKHNIFKGEMIRVDYYINKNDIKTVVFDFKKNVVLETMKSDDLMLNYSGGRFGSYLVTNLNTKYIKINKVSDNKSTLRWNKWKGYLASGNTKYALHSADIGTEITVNYTIDGEEKTTVFDYGDNELLTGKMAGDVLVIRPNDGTGDFYCINKDSEDVKVSFVDDLGKKWFKTSVLESGKEMHKRHGIRKGSKVTVTVDGDAYDLQF